MGQAQKEQYDILPASFQGHAERSPEETYD